MASRTTWQPATELGAFVAGLTYADVPAAARDLIERCFVDTVGVTLAGVTAGAGALATEIGAGDTDDSAVRLPGTGRRASATDAAFALGTAGHALDFDDYTYAYPLHPSVVTIAPVLALAPHTDASGRDAIAAYAAGFETMYGLVAPMSRSHYERGWHATGTIGTFGAAAAAASLLGLDAEATRRALSIAASMPAGLRRNFGTHTKPMHAGGAARSGVTAARLAARGFTADAAAIEGEGGFFDLYGAADGLDRAAVVSPGDPWGLIEEGVTAKKFPSCGATHSSIEGAAALANEHDLDPAAVASVEVEVAPFAADALAGSRPETGLEAKFSMAYCVAAAITRDRVGLADFENDAVGRDDVEPLLDRVAVRIDEGLHYNDHRSTVTVETTAGERYVSDVPHPPGTMQNPLTAAELEEKFLACATRAVPPAAARSVYDALSGLRDVEDLDAVLAATVPAQRP